MARIDLRLLVVLVLVAGDAFTAGSTTYPFAFLTPSVVMDPADRARLETGASVVRMLPARGRELAAFAAVPLDASGDRLIAWTRRIEQLLKGRYVPVIRRFSDPPRLDDLEALSLDDDELEDIRRCRPGDCGVKLGAEEMAWLQRNIKGGSDWKHDLQDGFRRVILQRAHDYLARGYVGTPPYNDDRTPVDPELVFATLVKRLEFLPRQFPPLCRYLQLYPLAEQPQWVESFLYWSKETLGGKPITTVTHVTIVRSDDPGLPEAMVVSKQVFASHYKDGSLMVTAVTGPPSARFLVYVLYSEVDVLHGLFGGLVRGKIERRIRGEAPALLDTLRRRLEGGDPG